MKRAIIVAGGKASRFDGVIKELLPINDNGLTTLEHNLHLAFNRFNVDEVVIVTNTDKVAQHAAAIRLYGFHHNDIFLRIQASNELAGAISDGISLYADSNIVLLADTYKEINDSVDLNNIPNDLTFGVFNTEPARFSILHNGKIITKPSNLHGIYKAWGIIALGKVSTRLFSRFSITMPHYDDILNRIINVVGYATFPIDVYFDNGNIDVYEQKVKGH